MFAEHSRTYIIVTARTEQLGAASTNLCEVGDGFVLPECVLYDLAPQLHELRHAPLAGERMRALLAARLWRLHALGSAVSALLLRSNNFVANFKAYSLDDNLCYSHQLTCTCTSLNQKARNWKALNCARILYVQRAAEFFARHKNDVRQNEVLNWCVWNNRQSVNYTADRRVNSVQIRA